MIQIEPVIFPLNQGIATHMTVTVLNFATNAVTCKTYYELISEENNLISRGEYTLTEEEFAAWGLDNTYINQCVANAIGVTIINQTE